MSNIATIIPLKCQSPWPYPCYGGILPDFEFKKENKLIEDALNKVYIYLTSMTIWSYEGS
jgi:hypothetical protein